MGYKIIQDLICSPGIRPGVPACGGRGGGPVCLHLPQHLLCPRRVREQRRPGQAPAVGQGQEYHRGPQVDLRISIFYTLM